MKKKKEPEKHNDFEDAFIREIDEELKNEHLKKLWDKYGLFIILFVVIAISAAVSFETFKAWQEKRNQEFSDAYAYALNLQNQGRYAEAMEVLNNLTQAKKGIYSDVAEIQKANVLLERGKVTEALAVLEKVTADEDFNPQMKDVAIIKLASFKLDYAPSDEIKTMLNPFIEQESTWTNIAKEMLAMLAIRDNDFETAKNLYQEISVAQNTSDTLKARAQDMINVLEQAQKDNDKK